MSLRCMFGHDWQGCLCSGCGKARDTGHDWGRDCQKCCKCGAAGEGPHDWIAEADRCARCGTRLVDANFQRWKSTLDAERFVTIFSKGWNHNDWLKFLSQLRKSNCWPMEEAAIGQHLQAMRARVRPSPRQPAEDTPGTKRLAAAAESRPLTSPPSVFAADSEVRPSSGKPKNTGMGVALAAEPQRTLKAPPSVQNLHCRVQRRWLRPTTTGPGPFDRGCPR